MEFSSKSEKIRFLISVELAAAAEPLTTIELSQCLALVNEGVSAATVSRQVHLMMHEAGRYFIARIPNKTVGRRGQFAYFDPRKMWRYGATVAGAMPARDRRTSLIEEVNTVNHQTNSTPACITDQSLGSIASNATPVEANAQLAFDSLPQDVGLLFTGDVGAAQTNATNAQPAPANQAVPTVSVPITHSPPLVADTITINGGEYYYAVWRMPPAQTT